MFSRHAIQGHRQNETRVSLSRAPPPPIGWACSQAYVSFFLSAYTWHRASESAPLSVLPNDRLHNILLTSQWTSLRKTTTEETVSGMEQQTRNCIYIKRNNPDCSHHHGAMRNLHQFLRTRLEKSFTREWGRKWESFLSAVKGMGMFIFVITAEQAAWQVTT